MIFFLDRLWISTDQIFHSFLYLSDTKALVRQAVCLAEPILLSIFNYAEHVNTPMCGIYSV